MRSSTHTYDLVIVGGGLAGVAAALEASRRGLRTALIEKTIFWGGLATAGLVPIYMALDDGCGHQVTFGLAEELLHASLRYGPGHVPAGWLQPGAPEPDDRYRSLYPPGRLDTRYAAVFSPVAFAFALDELLGSSGVELWLDSLACTPLIEDSRVEGVEIETKGGRVALRASCMIDASGDADIAARAGAPCREFGSYPTYVLQYTSLDLAGEAVAQGSAGRLVTWRGGGTDEFDQGYDGMSPRYLATDARQITRFVMDSRRLAREAFARDQREAGEHGRNLLYPAALPAIAQYRMGRRILGRETTPESPGVVCDSSVGMVADCRQTGAVWEVPYGSLLPQRLENLLVAGRCSSAEGYAWQVTRLIPGVVLTGQVAAVAAALAIDAGIGPAGVSPRDLQRALQERGIRVH